MVYLVLGFDVGGNSGEVVLRAFANEADAVYYAEHAKIREHNHTFWPGQGAAFEVQPHDVVQTLDEVAGELVTPEK